jgi:rfaE bifunctional protein nucleotidyltransferase chain/domain
MSTSNKIKTLPELLQTVLEWRNQGQKIVFTNGCFDLLHLGHVDYLEKASELADRMVIGLNTDQSVSRLKGPSRPLQDEYSRARIMAALDFVDAVVLFDEPTPLKLIEAVSPDILTKGDDYTIENIVGADFVLGKGGRVVTVPLVQGYSTTNIVRKISSSL